MKYLIAILTATSLAVVGTFLYISSVNASTTHLAEFKQPFTESAFRNAQQENKLILVDVYATWCSTCARQQRALNSYFENNPDSEIVVFEVDFDSQKEWVSYFNAPRQSTFALYRGEEQLWFAVAQTRQRVINSELSKHDIGAE
ncbi:MAG: thioredoxin family protein [Idiomarina sp.]|nr:thioredoxin family protein [Idiomarina sp.]